MGDIKSAREIAMEKLEKLGEATEEERLRWKCVPEGEKLAARYIRQDCNLVAELSRYEEKERKYIAEGAQNVLVRSIDLPRDDTAKRTNRQAMDGLKELKSDKASVENVYSQMRHIFNHYEGEGEQQRQQAYEELKAEFEAKVSEALAQQLGVTMGLKIDIESQPQFQEQWRRLQSQLDSQYLTLLQEYKQELKSIT